MCTHKHTSFAILADDPLTTKAAKIGPLKYLPNFIYSILAGTLEAVSNLTSVSTPSIIQLSWQPPFSLNLITAEPDIFYCVDVFNITSGETEFERDHLISNCSVFQTYTLLQLMIQIPKTSFSSL